MYPFLEKKNSNTQLQQEHSDTRGVTVHNTGCIRNALRTTGPDCVTVLFVNNSK